MSRGEAPVDSESGPPSAGLKGKLVGGFTGGWTKYAELYVAAVSLAGAVVVASTLYGNGVHGWRQPGKPVEPGTETELNAARPPAPLHRGRGWNVGDVQIRRGQQMVLREGGRSGSPNLLEVDDQRRLDIVQQARTNPGVAKEHGITRDQLVKLTASRRGSRLNVPESTVNRIRELRDRTEREIAIAEAAAAARDDFLQRTDEALRMLREVVPDPK